jgi:SecD/SecF fusion protein
MPIIALLLFGGSAGSTELTDFAFALLVGVASGAYSSIFIASPVLTHWKERESQYRHRRQRIESEFGYVPAYATSGADVEPARRARRTGRLTEPSPEGVSAAEFEQMKRDLDLEDDGGSHRTSTLTKRLAHSSEEDAPVSRQDSAVTRTPRSRTRPGAARRTKPADGPQVRDGADGGGNGAPSPDTAPPRPDAASKPADDVERAPDAAENEGVAPTGPKRPPKPPRSRNRRHGRRR